MKHAVIILAHTYFETLNKLVDYFNKDCFVFIHVDKKIKVQDSVLHELSLKPQVVKIYRKYKMHWGGYSILKCEIFMLKEAVKHCKADYYHLLSGQDYPIKPLDFFLDFFIQNCGKDFIRCAHLPNPGFDNNTFARFQYFYPYDFLNDKSEKSCAIVRKLIDFQKKIGIKRSVPYFFDHLYGSTQWFSLTKESILIILDYTDFKSAFYKRCRYSFASEEIYISTVLINNIRNTQSVIKRDMRFILWKNENGNNPANLSTKHFRQLAISDNLFARKFALHISDKLLELVDLYLLDNDGVSETSNGIWVTRNFTNFNFDFSLSNKIIDYCKKSNVHSVLDLGCGPGFYVHYMREKGISATGYDGNPHTQELSSLILKEGDEPCGVVDITEELECDELFDLVLCIDVLSFIPETGIRNVLRNSALLSKKFTLLLWSDSKPNAHNRTYTYSEKYIIDIISGFGMKHHQYFSYHFKETNFISTIKYDHVAFFEKSE